MIEPTTDLSDTAASALAVPAGDSTAEIANRAAEIAADLYAQSERQSRHDRFERVLERAALDA